MEAAVEKEEKKIAGSKIKKEKEIKDIQTKEKQKTVKDKDKVETKTEENIAKAKTEPKKKKESEKNIQVEKKVKSKKEQKKEVQKEEKLTLYKMIQYFIIYSVIGFIIETLFGIFTKGVWESRQSMLYGPFCCIYGLGAVIFIIGLRYCKKNNFTLFLGGFILGSIVEYIISLIGEFIFHIKWWDYSDMPFNLNGRVCVWFSLFWAVLAIFMMRSVNPGVDKLISKIPKKIDKPLITLLTIFLFFNFTITSFALKVFFTRLVTRYELDIPAVDSYYEKYEKISEEKEMAKFLKKWFSDEKMLKTFPNIKYTNSNGEIVWIRDVLADIQPYHMKFFTPSYTD